MKTRLILAISLFMLVLGSPAHASYPVIDGTYTGAITDTETCPPTPGPAFTSTETSNVTVVVSNLNTTTGNFDVAVTSVATDDGTTVNYTGTGQFTAVDQVYVTFSGTNELGASESWSGELNVSSDGNTLTTIFLNGTETGGPNCTFAVGAGQTLTRAGTGSIVNPEVAPSNTVTSDAATLNQVITTTTNALAGRIQSALSGLLGGGPRRVGNNYMYEANTGLAAGDTFQNIGVWGSYAYSDFDNDFARTKYDGDRYMIFAGVDFSPRDNMVLGVSVGYEDTSIDTDFNNGKLDADGWTIAPYFGMILNDTWNIDVSAGWSEVDTDQNRNFGAISSDVDTDRWFLSANINGFTQVDNWLLTGRAGLLNAQSEDDDFTEVGAGGLTVNDRTTNLTQFTIGGEAAYAMGNFEPFVSAYYNNDLHATETVLTAGRQPSNDDDDVLVGLGFRYFNDDNLSISAQYDTRQGRDDIDEDTISINARWDF